MRAHAVHLVKHAVRLAVQVAFNAQRGKFVGDNAQVPPGSIAALFSGAVSQNLRRRLLLIAGTKRTEAPAFDLYALTGEVTRTPRAIGGDDYPASCDRIFSQLRHRNILQLSVEERP